MATEREIVLINWIKEQIAAGASVSSVKRQLIERGYEKGIVNSLIFRARTRRFLLFGAIILTAIVLGIVLFLWLRTPSSQTYFETTSCDTLACFSEAANNCSESSYQQNIAGTLFYFTSKNCVLTKTVQQINETEPQEIKDLFKDTGMICTYSKNNFNVELVTTLTKGIENCEGSLKDAIEALIS